MDMRARTISAKLYLQLISSSIILYEALLAISVIVRSAIKGNIEDITFIKLSVFSPAYK